MSRNDSSIGGRTAATDGDGNEDDDENPIASMRRRNRAVAEREASRLARPDRSVGSRTLGHATKSKSAVSSTPFGNMFGGNSQNKPAPADGLTDDVEEWCGPFSVARQMIAAREQAKRQREEQQAEDAGERTDHHPLDDIMEEAAMKKKREENPSMNWVGQNKRRDVDGENANANYYVKRRKRFIRQKQLTLMSSSGSSSSSVKSLYGMCIDYLVDNFEHVDSLGFAVDSSIRRALCETLVARGKFDGAAFDAIAAERGIESLEIVDCTPVTQDQFCDALKVLLPSGLRALLLRHCGRCFGSRAVETILAAGSGRIELFAISLSGAYLLKDADMAKLLRCASTTLTSIELVACPLIGAEMCQALSECFSSSSNGSINGCLLELSLEEVPVSKGCLLSIGASSDALRHLKSLKLKTMENVDDEVVSVILSAVGSELEGIDLSNNDRLSDEILSSIRRCNIEGKLRSLQLSGLKNLTSIGLEAFFTPIDDLPVPPVLRKLDFSQCNYDEINDEVMALVASTSSIKKRINSEDVSSAVKTNALLTDVWSTGGLVHVNIGGSCVTDKTMEILAATCASSLEELDVSFCSNVSDKGLGYLVSKTERQFSRVHVWGCAQFTEDFFDGHDRIDEGGLEVVGMWMKSAGVKSLP